MSNQNTARIITSGLSIEVERVSTYDTVHSPKAAAPVLLSMDGTYTVSPDTTSLDLHNDIGCWIRTIGASIDMIIDGMNYQSALLAANPRMVTDVLYGVRHHLEMVQGGLSASYQIEVNATRNGAKDFVTIDRELAQEGAGEFEAAHEILELAWEVMNDATRAKFTKHLKDSGWHVSEDSPTRNGERKELLEKLEVAIYGTSREVQK